VFALSANLLQLVLFEILDFLDSRSAFLPSVSNGSQIVDVLLAVQSIIAEGHRTADPLPMLCSLHCGWLLCFIRALHKLRHSHHSAGMQRSGSDIWQSARKPCLTSSAGTLQVKMVELEVLTAESARLAAGCAALLPLSQATQAHK